MLYGKSEKQYYVLPCGSEQLWLVMDLEFREREQGYLGELKSAPLPPMPMNVKMSDLSSGMMDKLGNPLSMNMERNKPLDALDGLKSQGEKSTPMTGVEQTSPSGPSGPGAGG